jgi:hypothetical protein
LAIIETSRRLVLNIILNSSISLKG